MGGRRDRERRTVEVMIGLYCRDHHEGRGGLCGDCTELRDYALERLGRCRFGGGKPTCANCTVHCYRPDMRERVLEVMRHSGPRMLLRHPYLAIAHLVDGRRRPP